MPIEFVSYADVAKPKGKAPASSLTPYLNKRVGFHNITSDNGTIEADVYVLGADGKLGEPERVAIPKRLHKAFARAMGRISENQGFTGTVVETGRGLSLR